jgi:hypothetical protein
MSGIEVGATAMEALGRAAAETAAGVLVSVWAIFVLISFLAATPRSRPNPRARTGRSHRNVAAERHSNGAPSQRKAA